MCEGMCERVCEEQCNTATHQTAPCLHQLGGVRGVCEGCVSCSLPSSTRRSEGGVRGV